MKKGIHPEWNNVKVFYNGKEIMKVGSTEKELNVEIWAGSHPFYTGEQILVDTDDLVKKFNERKLQAQKLPSSKALKKIKKEKAKKSGTPTTLTLKDMLSQIK